MADPTLLLIHGLGATSGVWHDLVEALDWPGRVVAPDLPGHGSAAWTGDYTLGALAAGVAQHVESGEDVVIVGHSLGGGVGLALASGLFRPVVRGVVALGVKVAWSDDDIAGMAGVAAKGVRWCETREEAVQRYLRNSGLVGLIEPNHPAVVNAVAAGDTTAGETGWRVAQDPMTFAQGKLDMGALLAAAACPVLLGAGANDAMVRARRSGSARRRSPHLRGSQPTTCRSNAQIGSSAYSAKSAGEAGRNASMARVRCRAEPPGLRLVTTPGVCHAAHRLHRQGQPSRRHPRIRPR